MKRTYWVYDGTFGIGHFVVDEESGKAKAFNSAGHALGEFADYDAARKAVSNAHYDAIGRRAATQEALERLNGPVEFKSGWPSW
jgi:hypothetical protein